MEDVGSSDEEEGAEFVVRVSDCRRESWPSTCTCLVACVLVTSSPFSKWYEQVINWYLQCIVYMYIHEIPVGIHEL